MYCSLVPGPQMPGLASVYSTPLWCEHVCICGVYMCTCVHVYNVHVLSDAWISYCALSPLHLNLALQCPLLQQLQPQKRQNFAILKEISVKAINNQNMQKYAVFCNPQLLLNPLMKDAIPNPDR